MHSAALALFLALGVSVTLSGCGEELSCFGNASRCSERFDALVYPTTHNAMATTEDNWGAPNQHFGVARQLRDGVRGFMLDTYDFDGEPSLCHGTCNVGSRPLAETLGQIRTFLDENPGEIVTLILESYLSAPRTREAFDAAGLLGYLATQSAGDAWPTVREMLDRNWRIVLLTDSGGGAWPGYLDQFTYAFQNAYAAEKAADFTCGADRGKATNALYVFNHFLTAPLASPKLAADVNFNPLLVERLRACETETGRLPNFITVDYYDIGDLFPSVSALQPQRDMPL